MITFSDAEAYAAKAETPERDTWSQPERVINEVIKPLLASAVSASTATSIVDGAGSSSSSGRPVVLDVGSATGYLISRLAKALPDATIIGTDTEVAMREYCTKRCEKEGLSNVVVGEAGTARAGPLPAPAGQQLPAKAHLIVLMMVYHHIEANTEANPDKRIAWLRNTVNNDLVEGGYVVIVEHKSGDLPIPIPPDWMRLSQEQVITEGTAAGLSRVEDPKFDFLPYQHIIVFRRK